MRGLACGSAVIGSAPWAGAGACGTPGGRSGSSAAESSPKRAGAGSDARPRPDAPDPAGPPWGLRGASRTRHARPMARPTRRPPLGRRLATRLGLPFGLIAATSPPCPPRPPRPTSRRAGTGTTRTPRSAPTSRRSPTAHPADRPQVLDRQELRGPRAVGGEGLRQRERRRERARGLLRRR